MDNRLAEAIKLIHEGNKPEAGKLLIEIVKENPTDDSVWYYLGLCVKENNHKKHCFTKALELNPENQLAKDELFKLTEIEFEKEAVEVFEKDSQKQEVLTDILNLLKKKETDKSLFIKILLGILGAAILIGLIALQHKISEPKFENLFTLKAAVATPVPSIKATNDTNKYYCARTSVDKAFDEMTLILEKGGADMTTFLNQIDKDSSDIRDVRPLVELLLGSLEDAKKVEIPPCLEKWKEYNISFLEHLIEGFVLYSVYEPENARTQLDKATEISKLVLSETARIKACYPNCK